MGGRGGARVRRARLASRSCLRRRVAGASGKEQGRLAGRRVTTFASPWSGTVLNCLLRFDDSVERRVQKEWIVCRSANKRGSLAGQGGSVDRLRSRLGRWKCGRGWAARVKPVWGLDGKTAADRIDGCRGRLEAGWLVGSRPSRTLVRTLGPVQKPDRCTQPGAKRVRVVGNVGGLGWKSRARYQKRSGALRHSTSDARSWIPNVDPGPRQPLQEKTGSRPVDWSTTVVAIKCLRVARNDAVLRFCTLKSDKTAS